MTIAGRRRSALAVRDLPAALAARAVAPIDVASLAVFRIAFGLLCFLLGAGLLLSGFPQDWSRSCDVELHWWGLSWIRLPCHSGALAGLLGVVALSGLGVAVGVRGRLSAAVLAGGMAYGMLADQAIYSSTYYLMLLFALVLAISPADRALSFDERRAPRGPWGPAWPLWLLRFHTAAMYGFAALAKLDADWLQGLPIAWWLQQHAALSLVGPALQAPGVAVALAWGGLLFDALIVPAVVWRRTRVVALAVAAVFHLFNGVVLEVFPLPVVAMAATTLLLPPEWPRRFLRVASPSALPSPTAPASGWRVAFLAAWVASQLALPLRHLAYPGPVAWNEDGDELAWRLRARAKQRQLRLHVVDPATGERRRVKVKDRLHWLKWEAVNTYPDRLLQLAHQIAREEAAFGRRVEVHVRYRVGLNGRPLRDFVSPTLDLAAQPRTFLNSSWIEPAPD